jgi:4-hydroxy 2-oxovalerate aldolase
MIKETKIFDCTLRETGYQTGWFFTREFCRDLYRFSHGKGIDYIELGFFHNPDHDNEKGYFRYCSVNNREIKEIFRSIKNRTKISAMRDIQRPLSDLVPKSESIIDTIRILTRSHETNFTVLENQIKEISELGYEVFVNFTSAGYNTIDINREFAEFVKKNKVDVIYFADTESVMTPEYVIETIKLCHDIGLKVGMHFHNKNGTATLLSDIALKNNVDYIDVTHLGLGGKWRDGNLTVDYILEKMHVSEGYELTRLKNELIDQLIKFNEFSSAE